MNFMLIVDTNWIVAEKGRASSGESSWLIINFFDAILN